MNTDYTIKNFRIFDNKGTYVDIRPVTILTGCNNSGKSTITKSLCLLKDFNRQAEDDFNDKKKLRLGTYRFDFHKHPNDILGSFKHVLHKSKNADENQEDSSKYITFQVVAVSRILQQFVKLELEFSAIDGDELDNAYLHKYSIYDLQDHLIFTSEYKGDCHWDYSYIKKSLLYFLYGQYTSAKLQETVNFAEAYSCAYDKKIADSFDNSLKKIYKDLGGNSLVHILEWQFSGGNHYEEDGTPSRQSSLINDNKVNFTSNIDLGVFCYFPVIDLLKDETSDNIQSKIESILSEKDSQLKDSQRQIVDLLLLKFKNSKAKTFLDFISQFEDEVLFRGKGLLFTNEDFSKPYVFSWDEPLFGDSDLPEEANWQVFLNAMDILNKLLIGTKESLLFYDDINSCHIYYQQSYLSDIFNKINEDILVQIIPGELFYTGTSTAQLKRMYSLEDDSDFENSLRLYFESKRLLNKIEPEFIHGTLKQKEKYIPCTFINKWIKEFKLGDHIQICSHAEGYGVTIRIYDSANDKDGMLLSEKGYGATQIFAILLKIENAILQSEYNNIHYKYNATALSEAIRNLLRQYSDLHPFTIALEEPENHLHPSMQSMLADMMVDAFSTYGIHFLLETHSEYVVRKLQLLTAQKKINSDSVSILYVNSSDRPQYIPQITNIGISEDGLLKNEFGTGFFDESLKLSKALFNPDIDNHEE